MMKSIFLSVLEKVVGRMSRHPEITAYHHGLSSSERSFFSRWLRRIMYQDAKPGGPGKKLNVITSNDLNPDTGKLYPDYKARREARKRQGSEARSFGYVDHDVYPDI